METVLLRDRGAYGLSATAATLSTRQAGCGSANSGCGSDPQYDESGIGM